MNRVRTEAQATNLWCPHIDARCRWNGCMAWEAAEPTTEVTLETDDGNKFTDYQLGIMEGMMQNDVYFSYSNLANAMMPAAAVAMGQKQTKNLWRESIVSEFKRYNAGVPMHKDYNITGFCTIT